MTNIISNAVTDAATVATGATLALPIAESVGDGNTLMYTAIGAVVTALTRYLFGWFKSLLSHADKKRS